MNVKFHSNQKTIDLFTVENVSKIINHNNVVVALDMVEDQVLVEDQVMVEMTEVLGLVEVQETTDQEKCLQQPAVTVEMNVKFHSNQKRTDLFTAKNVSKITDKISKLKLLNFQLDIFENCSF
jgi:hypothetical protein